MSKAIYAGSFNPFTNGHLSIARKAAMIFDEVIIVVAINPNKPDAFLKQHERIDAIKQSLKEAQINNFSVQGINGGLIANHAKSLGIHHLIRGLRPLGDFEPEYNMAMINHDLAEANNFDLETVFLLADPATAHMSSTLVREVLTNGGSIERFVPKAVVRAIENRMENN